MFLQLQDLAVYWYINMLEVLLYSIQIETKGSNVCVIVGMSLNLTFQGWTEGQMEWTAYCLSFMHLLFGYMNLKQH